MIGLLLCLLSLTVTTAAQETRCSRQSGSHCCLYGPRSNIGITATGSLRATNQPLYITVRNYISTGRCQLWISARREVRIIHGKYFGIFPFIPLYVQGPLHNSVNLRVRFFVPPYSGLAGRNMYFQYVCWDPHATFRITTSRVCEIVLR